MSNFDHRNQGDVVTADRPDAPAIIAVTGSGARRLTYREFDAAVDAVAAWTSGQGLSRGDAVGIIGENTPEWLVAFYALQRAGFVPVPVSYKLPSDGVAYVLENAGAKAVFADARGGELVAGSGVRVWELDGLIERTPRGDGKFASVVPDPEDPAMILYTSGSTGRPKGVVLSQRSHLWVLGLQASTPGPADARYLVAAPLYHMNALANCQQAFGVGATVVLLPKFSARQFLQAVGEHRVTRVTGVPPMFALLLREDDLVATVDTSSVIDVFMGSAPASQALFHDVRALFPRADLHFGYGTTESGPVAFTDHPGGLPTPDGSVGVADPAVELRLVDSTGTTATGEGVLEIRCPALMTGYHRRPDLPSPVTADGFYHTKDVFRVDDNGFYFFTGREDDMFTSGGENVYPAAVEEILESHPAVRQAAVIGVPDEIKGHKPVAFVSLRPATQAGPDELRKHVLDNAEPYAHPRQVWIVDELPLSSTNKIDRNVLAHRAAELLGGAAT
ncbi:Acyl-CoA synthetase (AMP-forming)/AMP-acid ligase II [Saccharopolyspora shandongensis]|uniref:Acyl-CoA synthetase (AMP-forming)/AMP-acid ligase II n=1 Tax=Saccharopolyspora shandongensis TaxID=418495 RepID=A0A1H3QA89_9PSEU|nr:class I adenylate-forming enzyme family protein [Saccharopolyspora shandongensis]SDZ10183.1 Acyl-CoA synthetase (AMP-forming)/AMP-acid ligase II [Saccharopolyspora shandongensis]